MKAPSLSDFLAEHEGANITRLVYVYNLLLVFRDGELPGKDLYYLLNNKRHTAWHDCSFFDISKKLTLEIPEHTERAVRKALMCGRLECPEEKIREFLWNTFRVRPSDGVEEIPGLEDVLAYRSKEFEANTACLLKYYNIPLSIEEMTKLVRHPQTIPFSEAELREMAAGGQLSNPVRLWFTSDNGTRPAQAWIHDVEDGSTLGEEVTALFSDMKDFSEMVMATHQVFTDDRALQEFRVLCKRYQLGICRDIRVRGGEIIHTAGDAFLAVFRDDDAASRAFASARDMLATVAQLQRDVDFKKLKTGFITRIGLATGKAQHGYLGPYEMKERTVFGRCINVASRLEGAVKHHSPTGGILLTAETAAKIKDFNQAELKEVTVAVKELDENLKCFLLPHQD